MLSCFPCFDIYVFDVTQYLAPLCIFYATGPDLSVEKKTLIHPVSGNRSHPKIKRQKKHNCNLAPYDI
jgi:hypothetical protein